MPRPLLYPFLLLILAIAGLVLWLQARDPLASLPPPQHGLVAERNLPVIRDGRRLEHVTLSGGALGDIGFVVNLPDPLSAQKKIPVLIVLGGFSTGQNNIRAVKNPGPNAIVGYDWPVPVRFPSARDFAMQGPDLYRRILAVPGQIASVIGWLVAQPWADAGRISILGFSLGALAAPAAGNLAAHAGHPAGWTIIAYGGAPLGALFAANAHTRPVWLREALAPAIDLLLHPLQPDVNLPHLPGRFLVLEGRDDALIPEAARDRLREAVPQPRDVIVFGGNHMNVGTERQKQALLDDIIKASREWLARNGAIDNPGP